MYKSELLHWLGAFKCLKSLSVPWLEAFKCLKLSIVDQRTYTYLHTDTVIVKDNITGTRTVKS